jgi:hypothetical protein
MDLAQGARKGVVSRRQALVLLGAAAAVRGADAAEQAIMQPISLDHVNIRVSNVARTGEFYMGLFDTPVLRNAALRPSRHRRPAKVSSSGSATAILPYRRRSLRTDRTSITIPSGFATTRKHD